MNKKILGVLLICGLVIFGVGCSKKQTEDNKSDQAATRTLKFVTDDLNAYAHPVRLVTTLVQGEETQKVELGMKNGEYYMEFYTQELGNKTLIFKKDVIYSISHNNKTVVETESIEELLGEDPLEIFPIPKSELVTLPMETGTDTLNGQTYEFEQFTKDDLILRLLFDGQVCKAVKSTQSGVTQTMIIDQYDQNVDESKMQPPSDYQTQKPV